MRVNPFIQFIATNLGWMIASVLLAVVIWVAANMANNPVEQDEIRGVPVEIALPEGFVVTHREPTAPSTVTAVIRATQSEWDVLVTSDVLVTANLDDVDAPGEYRVELDADLISQRRGSVVAVRPGAWEITVDRKVETRLGIQVVVTNDPPIGYTYPVDLGCDDTEVVIGGSADAVSAVTRVEARLDLSNAQNPITETVALEMISISGERIVANPPLLTITPAEITCNVPIQQRTDVVQKGVLPKTVGTPPEGYAFTDYAAVQPQTIWLTGDPATLVDLPALVRTLPIDLTNHSETFTVDVPLDLPAGAQTVPENQSIRVTVIIEPQLTTRQFEDVPVEVAGLDPTQFRATGVAETVTVFIDGTPNRLPDREDVRVVIDLSSLPPGNHQVTPQGTIMGGDSEDLVIRISPDTLSVTIEALTPTPTQNAPPRVP